MNRGLTASILVCVAAAGIAVGALALDPGDGNDGQAAAQTGSGAAEEGGTLIIEDFAFSATTVEPGGTVTVENQDSAPHTATSADGSFDTGTIDPGGTITFAAPTVPGAYQFNCQIHPQMSGTLTVQAAAAEVPPDAATGAGEVTTTTTVTTPPTTQANGDY